MHGLCLYICGSQKDHRSCIYGSVVNLSRDGGSHDPSSILPMAQPLRNQCGRKQHWKMGVGSSTPGKAEFLKTSNHTLLQDSECSYNTQCLHEMASTSPTCQQHQCLSHQIPNHSQPNTQLVLNTWPGHEFVAGKGTQSEVSELMRNRGLVPRNAMGDNKDSGTLRGLVQNVEYKMEGMRHES